MKRDEAKPIGSTHQRGCTRVFLVMADFGQTDFGQFFDRLWPIVGLTDFGQIDFGQS